ncbi:MAG: hypothetical protein Q9187_003152, partial [Circinaria calcarea]
PSAHFPRCRNRQPQILLHQADAKPALVVVFHRRSGTDAGDGIVDLGAPAAAAAAVDEFTELERIEAEFEAEIHGFGGGEVGDG